MAQPRELPLAAGAVVGTLRAGSAGIGTLRDGPAVGAALGAVGDTLRIGSALGAGDGSGCRMANRTMQRWELQPVAQGLERWWVAEHWE